jgi:hypothetical protein
MGPPPGKYDPQGIHQTIWSHVTQENAFVPPSDKPLTLVSYQAGEVPTAYVEPTAVGRPLPDLPLFLDGELYVSVPLEDTYQATWNLLPQILRDLLNPPGNSA